MPKLSSLRLRMHHQAVRVLSAAGFSAGIVVAPPAQAGHVFEPDRRYTIAVGEPITVTEGAEIEALATWVKALEAAVRAHPEQWFNFFDAWSVPSAA